MWGMGRVCAVLVLLGCLTACGADKSRCMAADTETASAIAERVEGGKFQSAQAVKSTDFVAVYMTAGRISNGEVAVFATNDVPGDGKFDGMVQTANGFAEEFSDWPTSKVTAANDGVAEAKACVN